MVDFGDREYQTAEYNDQFTHHPGAPVTYTIGNVLRQAYWRAQNAGQICLIQSYGFNKRDIIGDWSVTRQFTAGSASRVGIARSYRRIPVEFNAVTARVLYTTGGAGQTQSYHELVCIRSGNCDSASLTQTYQSVSDEAAQTVNTSGLAVGQSSSGRSGVNRIRARQDFSTGFPIRTATITVEFSNISPTDTNPTQIRVAANAQFDDGSDPPDYTIAAMYRPLYIIAWCHTVF